jgi:hypothetical protein
MNTLRLALAASIAALVVGGTAQAQAQAQAQARAQGMSGGFDGDRHHRRMDHRDDRRRIADTALITDWNGGEWALYNNRSWQPDSYNDWWHDRPDRAFPRWMSHNQDCARPWYSGDTLRC